MLALEDLKDLTEAEVKLHIIDSYSDYGNDGQKAELEKILKDYNVVIAYESVGSWGCDSSSFFLLEKDGKYYEVHGGHCSCYGFEGQFEIEKESPLEYLKSDKFYFSTGGYDSDSDNNTQLAKEFIQSL